MDSEQELRYKLLEDALIKIRRIQYVTPSDDGSSIIAMVIRIAKDALDHNNP